MIAIIYYTVSVPFSEFDLYPLLENGGEVREGSAPSNIPVSVCASERAELCLHILRDGEELRHSESLAALAAGSFLYRVRGLPLTEADIEISGDIYTVKIDGEKKKVSLYNKKCKQLLPKTSVNVKNAEVTVADYEANGERIRLLECEDQELLSEELTRLLLYREGAPMANIAAAFSARDKEVAFRYFSSGRDGCAMALSVAEAIATHLSRYRPRGMGARTYSCDKGEAVIDFLPSLSQRKRKST